MALLTVKDICFSYGDRPLLADISFRVDRGEVFCLLGPNGCGKSTLLDCILGALRISSGDITINGKSIAGMAPGELAKLVAYVPQGHERTFPYTVLEIVTMGRAAYAGLFSAPNSRDRKVCESALDAVGIPHLKQRPYTRLSGGEGQLVLIARALAQDTPVIIMDEPTAHLDFRNELVVLETITRLVKEQGISVIMATHAPNHAFFFENNDVRITVGMLRDGGFIEMGGPEKVLREQSIKQLYGIRAGIISYGGRGEKPRKQVVALGTGS